MVLVLTLFLFSTIFILKLLFFVLRKLRNADESLTIGILHPDNHAGGGGERVLWCLVQAIQEKHPRSHIVIYSAHTSKFKSIQKSVDDTFNVKIEREVKFVNISLFKKLVDAVGRLPFTLLFQSLASMLMGFAALIQYTPHVFVDTTGYAFTLPVAKIFGGCKTMCYVHYPTISTDMLESVKEKRECVNNKESIAKSPLKTKIKLIYYKIFSLMYGISGGFSDVVMVNSTWTGNHIKSIWSASNKVSVVYPPVSAEFFYKTIPLNQEKREKLIVSIGQFRKEKDHFLQLDSFALFLKNHPKFVGEAKLILIGGSRNPSDEKRIKSLKEHSQKLEISDSVEFHVNASFKTLCDFLGRGIVGLHTMRDEHFGICVVEYQAAGVIPLAHNSAGPKMDIVVEYEKEKTGFLATTKEEYAEKMYNIIGDYFGDDEEKKKKMYKIQENSKNSSRRFSEEVFKEAVKEFDLEK